MDEMEYSKFEELTKESQDKVETFDAVKSKDGFELVCKKCGSKDTTIAVAVGKAHYSDYTGYLWTDDGGVVFKCQNCGNAKILIIKEDE